MGTKHSCKYYRLQADEYIEGELTDAQAREFEAHIAECEKCRREVESIRALNAILRSNRESLPEGLHSRIMDAVASEPKAKPRHKPAFFRGAAISAACFFICLSLTVVIAMLPMWNPNNMGGTGLPEDPDFAAGEVQSSSTEAALKSEGIGVTDEAVQEPESMTGSSSAEAAPEFEPSNTAAETMVVAESTALNTGEITAEKDSIAPPLETALPETVRPETTATANSEADAPAGDGKPSPGIQFSQAETSKAPGGDEITLALLIVSGLLAVASFIAFLISLSSIRNKPINKGDQK